MFIDAVWSRRHIGPIRLATACLGFLGTLLVLKPEVGGLSWANLIPVSAGMMYAFGNVATRKWCEGESAVALLWSYMFLMLIFGALGAVYLVFLPRRSRQLSHARLGLALRKCMDVDRYSGGCFR